jgi:decaprenylphospho-beta-D-erythro-pentofuranosid-2-ulose 2-reductase
MPKILIVGGSSEIGNAICAELQKKYPQRYSEITRLSTSVNSQTTIFWNPSDQKGIKHGLTQVTLGIHDTVIIALGTLGNLETSIGTSHLEKRLNHIHNLYNVNLLVPMLALDYFANTLESAGGGRIILLTSSAAFPVLDSNFMYGSAKYSLDSYGRYLQRSKSFKKTKITIVRSGFVQTKLNQGRKPTPFSRTSDEVAKLVVDKFDKPVVWTPPVFKFIGFALQYFWPLRFIAERFVGNSKK